MADKILIFHHPLVNISSISKEIKWRREKKTASFQQQQDYTSISKSTVVIKIIMINLKCPTCISVLPNQNGSTNSWMYIIWGILQPCIH